MSTIRADQDTRAVAVGDYFVCSWGYDQTNVNFYRVLSVTPSGKSVKVQEWSQTVEHEGSGCDRVMPGSEPVSWQRYREIRDEDGRYSHREPDGVEVAPIVTRRLTPSYDGSVRITVPGREYDHAHRWDGCSRYQTATGWGH